MSYINIQPSVSTCGLGINRAVVSGLTQNDVSSELQSLWSWLTSTNFTGYDPGSYHAPQLKRLYATSPHFGSKLWNKALTACVKFGGYELVRLLKLPKVTSTKAVALVSVGLEELIAKSAGDLASNADALIDWLVQNWRPDIKAWTPDFAYSIRGESVNRNKAGLINSVFAADALWRYYCRTGDSKIGKYIVATADGLVESLPRIESETCCCFTYNPSVDYYVHNANLMLALLLARASEIDGSSPHKHLVEKCVEYSVSDFEGKEEYPYAGPPTKNNTFDNYHTGFALRALSDLTCYIANPELASRCESILLRGVHVYTASFVSAYGVYKFKGCKGPVHAHSLAESILMHHYFGRKYGDAFNERYRQGVQSAIRLLWDPGPGYFISEAWTVYGRPLRKNRAPMPRWAWAWMFFALSVDVEE